MSRELQVGDVLPYEDEHGRHAAKIVKIWEPGLFNLRVYDPLENQERWFTWLHRVACVQLSNT